jgi:hypothetical protein
MTREMATQFINIYHETVHIHKEDVGYVLKNYTDEFYEGCMNNTPLFAQIRSLTYADAYPFVQTVYDAIHILMSPDYCLAKNIQYSIDYVNIDPQAVNYLNAANLNYHVLHKVYSNHYNVSSCYEDLSDATLEPNACSVCQYENNSKPAESKYLKKFYYSSAFSLNSPVCEDCLRYDQANEMKTAEKDPDYTPFVFKRACEAGAWEIDVDECCLAEACEDEYEDEVCEDEDEDEDEVHEDEVDVETDEDLSSGDFYNDADLLNENIVLTNTYSAVPYDYDAIEPINAHVATSNEDCYTLGWQGGWQAAMKYIEEQSHKAPDGPLCEYCGKSGKTMKCGGTCKGRVRYCSEECQADDWKQIHRYFCAKNTY